MKIEECKLIYTYTWFGPGDFRVFRIEAFGGEDMCRGTLIAEQPSGSWAEAIEPYIMTEEDMKYAEAVAKQQEKKDATSEG